MFVLFITKFLFCDETWGRCARAGAAQESIGNVTGQRQYSENGHAAGERGPRTLEAIGGYLEHLRSAGRGQGAIDNYRHKLRRVYRAQPEGGKGSLRGTPPRGGGS